MVVRTLHSVGISFNAKCYLCIYVSEASSAMAIKVFRLPNSIKHLDKEEAERIVQARYEQSIF
ncbi:uncharacterized protein RHIMIDRAFT_281770 [Rhizopus microsporus ATCC 52813]|uniref:Uncharacterized protein n=1 Tax=Rhizopus microsporus ATCC 52813 TaxID=1340429 RepID=A0A2G4SWW7_RHIZD|nr:uncharacterized protein RHIMIDRAFT_281770 [Rhizopus microsporus ATCC 52813]PHZ13244.1 hypothetical protein RHIMIDRAFT_281770 [Rhizopus microsporus ATCC 52813]